MTRPIVIAGVLVLTLAPLATAERAVRVEGVFVRTGTFVEVDQVEVGQPVQLLVSVRDISDEPVGVAGGLVDVTWNSTVLHLQDAIDDTDTTTADVSPLFNQAVWVKFFTGVLVQDGQLDGMGAGQSVPPKLSEGDGELFFRLNFTPIGLGSASISLTGRDFGLIVSSGGEAAAERYESLNPTLTVTSAPDPNDTNGDTNGGGPCLGTVAPVMGLLAASGLIRGLSPRRGARRRPRSRSTP